MSQPVLITDLDNTLCVCGPYYREAVEYAAGEIARMTGIPVLDVVALIDLIDRCMIDARGVKAFQLDRMHEALVKAASTACSIAGQAELSTVQHHIASQAMGKIICADYPLLPGVWETLEHYTNQGWRIVIWTKGEHAFQIQKVQRNGLLKLVAARDVYVTPIKEPHTLAQLLVDLDISKDSVGAVVGDSKRDEIRCAEFLGIPAILVGGGFGPPGYEPEEESKIDSFADLPKVLPVDGWHGKEAQDGNNSAAFTGT